MIFAVCLVQVGVGVVVLVVAVVVVVADNNFGLAKTG